MLLRPLSLAVATQRPAPERGPRSGRHSHGGGQAPIRMAERAGVRRATRSRQAAERGRRSAAEVADRSAFKGGRSGPSPDVSGIPLDPCEVGLETAPDAYFVIDTQKAEERARRACCGVIVRPFSVCRVEGRVLLVGLPGFRQQNTLGRDSGASLCNLHGAARRSCLCGPRGTHASLGWGPDRRPPQWALGDLSDLRSSPTVAEHLPDSCQTVARAEIRFTFGQKGPIRDNVGPVWAELDQLLANVDQT